MTTEEPMNSIVVFGGGGRAGRAILAEAVRRGHGVTAVVRDPSRHADLSTSGARLVQGDLTDPACAPAVADGAGALVNAVSPFTTPPASFDDFDHDYFLRLVRNLAGAGVPRVVEVGLAATLRTATGRLYEDPDAFPAFLQPFAAARMLGIAEWAKTDVDWVILTPPPLLSAEVPATGTYRLADAILQSVPAGTALSYADLATAVLDEIDSPTRHREQSAVYADRLPIP